VKIAVILSPVNLPADVPFFCMRCRYRLFHINRDILVVNFGAEYPAKEIPLGMGELFVKCHSCKVDYRFYWQ